MNAPAAAPHKRSAPRSTPKGRQVDPVALAEVRALLADRPRNRDLLIEHLHLIQDKFGHISAAHLAALAQEMRLAMAEVYEVATFYAHFDVIREGEAAPLPLTVRVCDSLSCEMAGAGALLEGLATALKGHARVVRAPCMGLCDKAPVVQVGHRQLTRATVQSVTAIQGSGTSELIPAARGFDVYCKDGGYALLRQCLKGERKPEDLIALLNDSGLRGLGGAGFPTGRKWGIVRGYPGPRLMAINADEGEPGTFKDRHYLETDPHRVIEGMLLAAWAVGAEAIYFYLRDEYSGIRSLLLAELDKVRAAKLDAHAKVHLRRGAGAYICGEESAMLESIEGKRGLPRHRPPYVAEKGLFDRPTLVQNVETLFWLRDIVEKGAKWFATRGGSARLHSYSVSGRVKNPGVKLAPAGISVRKLIEDHCGGMADGHVFTAYLPGGASGGILPAAMADEPLEFGQLEKHGCFLGSAAVVVLSDQDDVRLAALNLMRFFADESCGQCTPCRVGTEKAVVEMEKKTWNAALLGELAQGMADASICGLGQAAANPIRCVLKYFPEAKR
ncbi:MAG: NADH-quinone oxidoreductase subunit F [Rhodospirillales bacterium]|nr:NADH-quinone oxidoreductase subunit F [Rhodospirillales bacterium]